MSRFFMVHCVVYFAQSAAKTELKQYTKHRK